MMQDDGRSGAFELEFLFYQADDFTLHCEVGKVTRRPSAALAQLVRALDCGSRGPPFEQEAVPSRK